MVLYTTYYKEAPNCFLLLLSGCRNYRTCPVEFVIETFYVMGILNIKCTVKCRPRMLRSKAILNQKVLNTVELTVIYD